MSRGKKPLSSSITDNWEKAFFNSIGHYITLINKGLSKNFKSEPLSNHIKIVGGYAFKNSEYKSSGVPIIRISDFNNERIVLDSVVYYEESPLLEKYELKESDIIIALTGGTIGKLGIVQGGLGKLYLNQRVGKFDILNPNEFEKEYIYWIARGVEGIVKNLAWGAAIPNVSPKQIEELNFPIPSKDIQKNIIRFLNDLRNGNVTDDIYFDEEIENEIKDIQEKQVKLGKVQDELSHQLTLLENLNQAILQEAVQGKLVPQDPKDEPASELLKRIKAEKATLRQAQGKGKKEKPLPPIKPEEIPFQIPENWVWCRLGEILTEIKYGTSQSCDYDHTKNSKVLRIPNVSTGVLDGEDLKYTNLSEKEISELALEKDDILIIRSNGSRELVGRTVLVTPEFIGFAYAGYLVRFRFDKELTNPRYLLTATTAPFFRGLIETPLRTTVGINNINTQEMSNLFIPLPPLSEQNRIIQKLDELIQYCNELEASIKQSESQNEKLLQQVLREALRKEPVEA